ncbi:MAG: hypothetical protein QOD74_2771 [Variibacter sp.]|nr:hypothetical protein [Variibacter sp.]
MAVAARRLGHELIHVSNSTEILAAKLDFVIATASTQAKLTDVPTFGAIHEPRTRFFETREYFENLLSYDGYFTISESIARFLKAICASHGRDDHIGFYYNTPQQQLIAADIAGLVRSSRLRLCYFGTNWDPRAKPVFRELAKREFMRIYGPQQSWSYLNGTAYAGSVPFDGQSVQREYATFGAGLVVLSFNHLLDDVISNRIFEITSVGAAAICPETPWIKKHFGDAVYYYDGRSTLPTAVAGIESAIALIRENPQDAADRARRAREIFDTKFSAERVLSNAAEYYERWSARRAAPASAPSPMIDVIVRVGGRSVQTIRRAVESIDRQTAGRFRIIFVRYKALDLSALTKAQWNRIAEFQIVDCIGGRRAATLCAGLRALKSELFAVLDDDDYWLSHHIQRLLYAIRDVPKDRAYAYSGYMTVNERAAPESEPVKIVNFRAGQGDAWNIMGVFAMNSFLAAKSLLDGWSLDGWELETAEDSVLQAGLMARGEPRFSYAASAVVTLHAAESSTWLTTETRAEDVFECYARLGPALRELEKKLNVPARDEWQQIKVRLDEVWQRKIEHLAAGRDLLVLQENQLGIALEERGDVSATQISLDPTVVSLAGQSFFSQVNGTSALHVIPPPSGWAYGASIQLPKLPPIPDDRWIVLRFGAPVPNLGIGLLNPTGADFVSRIECPRSRLPVEIWLRLEPDASAMVLQNWAQPAETPILLESVFVAEQQAVSGARA